MGLNGPTPQFDPNKKYLVGGQTLNELCRGIDLKGVVGQINITRGPQGEPVIGFDESSLTLFYGYDNADVAAWDIPASRNFFAPGL